MTVRCTSGAPLIARVREIIIMHFGYFLIETIHLTIKILNLLNGGIKKPTQCSIYNIRKLIK